MAPVAATGSGAHPPPPWKIAWGPMQSVAHRLDERLPLKISVNLCSLDIRQRPREGVTENVSSRGARVVSSAPWKKNQRLDVRSLPGDFRARARVVYCEPLGRDEFAIGLQLLATVGNWK
jgi:hypothetical protein